MSTHTFTVPDERTVPAIVVAAQALIGRACGMTYTGSSLVLTFTPDLVAADVSALGEVVRAAQTPLTRLERNAIEPQLATGRAFLALSQADFIALTQNARDRMLFDNVSAQWRVIFRLLRDG